MMDKLETLDAAHVAQASDVAQLAEQDPVPWYKKKNLRSLYLALVPSALGVEMTSGYDGSVLNGLQAVTAWTDCAYPLSNTFCRNSTLS